MSRIVKRVTRDCIQINQSCYLFRMSGPDIAQFFTGYRVPDEDGFIQMQRVADGKHIFTESVGGVVLRRSWRLAGCTEATACDAVHVIVAGELARKLVKVVGRAAQPSK